MNKSPLFEYCLVTKFGTTHENLFAFSHRQEGDQVTLIIDEDGSESSFPNIRKIQIKEVNDDGSLPDPFFG